MSDTTSHRHPTHFDEKEFERRIPFKLIKTNLPGVYTTPAPATDEYDLRTVKPSDLIRHGMILRRPDAKAEPRLRAAWDKVFGRKWLARDHVVPHMVPRPGRTHVLRQRPTKHQDGTFTQQIWSGAGINTGTWTGVIGYWIVPTVSQPSEAQGTEGGWNSSSWIGIDGYATTNDVLQAGVEQRVDAQGNPSYFVWFEWFVTPPANLPPGTPVDGKGYPLAWVGPGGPYQYIYETVVTNVPVSPGQQMYCSVHYASNNTAGHIYIANEDTGQNFQLTLVPPPGASFSGASAEWIMEAPDGGEPISSLPSFTPVTFTSAIACGPNGATTNPETADTINITDASGNLLTSVVNGPDTTTITFIG
jgi:hypothetical protein